MTGIWERFWFANTPLVRLAVFRILILFVAFGTLQKVLPMVMNHAGSDASTAGREWNPIYLFEILGVEVPSTATAIALRNTLLAAFGCALLGLFTRLSCFVTAVLLIYFWGMAYSVGQAHHEKIALTFAVAALPFSPCGARLSLDALIRRSRGRRLETMAPPTPVDVSPWAGWPQRLTQVSIAIGYFFAGSTKLATSGLDWINGYSLQANMLSTGGAWGPTVGRYVWLTSLMSIAILVVQVGFPLAILFPRLRWFFVPGSALVHLAAWNTMNTGIYDSLWMTTILAFLHFEKVPDAVRSFVTTGSWVGRVIRTLIIFSPCALYLWYVRSRYFL